MFENFTDDGRRVLVHAKDVAGALMQDRVRSQYLLYAIAAVASSGTASKVEAVIACLGTTPEAIRDLLGPALKHGSAAAAIHLPFTDDLKDALGLAVRSSMLLGDNHVGPEHLFAGLVRATGSTAGQLLAQMGITEEKTYDAIRDSTPAPSPTAARTFSVFVPVGKSIFKNGGKVYPDHATAQAAHPDQEIAPFPLQLTDGEFLDVGAALPENRFKSWGSYASYPDAFTAAERFRETITGYEVVIKIMTPVTVEHRGKDAAGHDVILGRSVSYDRVRVASRVLG